MKLSIALSLASLAFACRSTPSAGVPLDAMLASQSAGYSVPAGAGDMAFTTSAALAAVQWSSLTERQLKDWHQIWTAVQGRADHPKVFFQDATDETANLFTRSPKDGFCTAFALRDTGQLHDPCLSGFLKSL